MRTLKRSFAIFALVALIGLVALSCKPDPVVDKQPPTYSLPDKAAIVEIAKQAAQTQFASSQTSVDITAFDIQNITVSVSVDAELSQSQVENGQTAIKQAIDEGLHDTEQDLRYPGTLAVTVKGNDPIVTPPPVANPNPIELWDFGGNVKSEANWTNKLNPTIINSWYPDIAAGTEGLNISSFVTPDLEFVGTTSDRLRTTNPNLTHFDTNIGNQADIPTQWYEPNEFYGLLHLNGNTNISGGDYNRQMVVRQSKQDDELSLFVRIDNSANTLTLQHSKDNVWQTVQQQVVQTGFEQLKLVLPYDGDYRILAGDTGARINYYRIQRQSAYYTKLVGKVGVPSSFPSGASLVFENTYTNIQYTAELANGNYNIELPSGYDYAVRLDGANSFVISSGSTFQLTAGSTEFEFDINVIEVQLTTLQGQIYGLDEQALQLVQFELTPPSDKIYMPELELDRTAGSYTMTLEEGVDYEFFAKGINDYQTTTAKINAAVTQIHFAPKATQVVVLDTQGLPASVANALNWSFDNLNEAGYSYSFDSSQDIYLRAGVYRVTAQDLDQAYAQRLTSNLVVQASIVKKTISFESTQVVNIPFSANISVGVDKQYPTINDALNAISLMSNRPQGETGRVAIDIQPGNYQEMLNITQDYITLKNSSSNPSIALQNKGVDIDSQAVRITSYYGHGYNYYSQGADFMSNRELLAINKENGYYSTVNQGGGSASHWNATVVVRGTGFEASDIIFENSFNQYISQAEADDIIVMADGNKGQRPTTVGDTSVQQRSFVERAAAIAIANNAGQTYFHNSRFVGRQDTFYGGTNTKIAVDGGIVMGAVDYIFGPMTAVFAHTELQLNTNYDDEQDIAYISASQTPDDTRGLLFYHTSITSAVPSVDTASSNIARPGYFGRPWAASGETAFVNTTIMQSENGVSLITPAGWNNTLGGAAQRSYEYNTTELSGANNFEQRAAWATILYQPKAGDVDLLPIVFLNGWNPFGRNSKGK